MLDLYVSNLESLGKSKTTQTNARNFIREFSQIITKNVAEVTMTDIDLYLVKLTQKGNIANTKRTKFNYVKGYFDYLVNRGIVQENPCKQTLKVPKKQIQDVGKENIKAMIESALSGYNRKVDIDTYPLMTILYTSGCRISEILELTTRDIKESSIIVLGKGNKQREVQVPQSTINLLKEYVEITRHRNQPIKQDIFEQSKGSYMFRNFKSYEDYTSQVKEAENYVFLTTIGTRRNNKTTTQKLKKYANKFNIDVDGISPHKWRHSYAMNLVEQNVPLDIISKQMGHASIATTQIYFETKKERVASAINNVDFKL